MTVNITPEGLPLPSAAKALPLDRTAIIKLAVQSDAETAVTTLAASSFDATNPTAHLLAEREAAQAELGWIEEKLHIAKARRDEFGIYGVRMSGPYASSTSAAVFAAVIAVLLYAIDTLALAYTQTVYVAQSGFFDRIAGDFWATVPYTLVVLLGAPAVFLLGLRQPNNVRQDKAAKLIIKLGLAGLGVFFLALAVMGSELLAARSPFVPLVAFALILGHCTASVLLGAGIGLAIKLNRLDTGTQVVRDNLGFTYGDKLIADLHEARRHLLARQAELARQLEQIGHARAAFIAACLVELANFQATLDFAAVAGREQQRSALLAEAETTTAPSNIHTTTVTPVPALN